MRLRNFSLGLFAVAVVVAMVAATGVFPTDRQGNYVGPGKMRTYYATGAAGTAIAETLDVSVGGEDVYYEIVSFRVVFSNTLVSTGNFTATIDSNTAAAHDFTFDTQLLTGYTCYGQSYNPPLVITGGDDVDFAFTLDGGDSAVTWGLEVIYRDRSE